MSDRESSSGDVFYKAFPDGCENLDIECEYVVIEWSDMRTEDNNRSVSGLN